MSQRKNPIARAGRYLVANLWWWLVPLAIIVAALILFIVLTEPPTESLPNIYMHP